MNPDVILNLTVLDTQWMETMVLDRFNHFPAIRQALGLQISHRFPLLKGILERTLDRDSLTSKLD